MDFQWVVLIVLGLAVVLLAALLLRRGAASGEVGRRSVGDLA